MGCSNSKAEDVGRSSRKNGERGARSSTKDSSETCVSTGKQQRGGRSCSVHPDQTVGEDSTSSNSRYVVAGGVDAAAQEQNQASDCWCLKPLSHYSSDSDLYSSIPDGHTRPKPKQYTPFEKPDYFTLESNFVHWSSGQGRREQRFSSQVGATVWYLQEDDDARVCERPAAVLCLKKPICHPDEASSTHLFSPPEQRSKTAVDISAKGAASATGPADAASQGVALQLGDNYATSQPSPAVKLDLYALGAGGDPAVYSPQQRPSQISGGSAGYSPSSQTAFICGNPKEITRQAPTGGGSGAVLQKRVACEGEKRLLLSPSSGMEASSELQNEEHLLVESSLPGQVGIAS